MIIKLSNQTCNKTTNQVFKTLTVAGQTEIPCYVVQFLLLIQLSKATLANFVTYSEQLNTVADIKRVSGKSKENKENLPEILVVKSNWQEVSTKTILVETKQFWQDEMHLVADNQCFVKREETWISQLH